MESNETQIDTGEHAIIISGYNEFNNHFHITDLYHSELPPAREWISEEELLEAIDSPFLGKKRQLWIDFSFTKESFDYSKEMSLNTLKRNIEFMKKDKMKNNLYFGIAGIRKLIDDLENWKLLSESSLSSIENQMFNELLNVIRQRDAHIGFLKVTQKILSFNFNEIINMFDINYHKYCKLRCLLFKGSKKVPFEILDRIKLILSEIADNEEKNLLKFEKTLSL